jgi:hypothetical protein
MRFEQQPVYSEHSSVYTASLPRQFRYCRPRIVSNSMPDRFQHAEGYALHIYQVKFKVFSFSGHTCAYYR